jgi:hypothetical protein
MGMEILKEGEIVGYYRRKKPYLQKRLDNEKVIKFKSYVSFYKSITKNGATKKELEQAFLTAIMRSQEKKYSVSLTGFPRKRAIISSIPITMKNYRKTCIWLT